MKADILTLKTLFQKDVHYLIPTFQRPYVWNQEDQWEPLWNDVRNIAERYIDEWLALGDEKKALAEARAGVHFLGAVVVQHRATPTGQLEARDVIDGQQRLTTLQLLLDAAQEVFEQEELTREAKQLAKLVLNDKDYADDDPDDIFKIWPTLTDRDAFRHAMGNDLIVEGFEDSPIIQAHLFSKQQVKEWLDEYSEERLRRAQELMTALMDFRSS